MCIYLTLYLYVYSSPYILCLFISLCYCSSIHLRLISLFTYIFSIIESIKLSINLSFLSLHIYHLFIYSSIYIYIYLSLHLIIYLSIYLSNYLFIYLSIYLFIYLFIYLTIYSSIYLFIFSYRYSQTKL